MSVENPRKTAEKTEPESLERSIVASLVKLTRAGKIKWEFTMFGTRAEYGGITYFSEDVQDTGPVFIVSKRIEWVTDQLGLPKYEHIASFNPRFAYFMHNFLYHEVYLKLPEVIEEQRRYKEREEQARKQAAERNAEGLAKLGEINRQLENV